MAQHCFCGTEYDLLGGGGWCIVEPKDDTFCCLSFLTEVKTDWELDIFTQYLSKEDDSETNAKLVTLDVSWWLAVCHRIRRATYLLSCDHAKYQTLNPIRRATWSKRQENTPHRIAPTP